MIIRLKKLPAPNPAWSAQFAAWLRSSPVDDRHYDPKTIKRYEVVVRMFLEFCVDFGLSSLDEANSAVLRGYLFAKGADGKPKYAASTRIVMQSALNLFWTWAMDNEHVVDNQIEKLHAERTSDRKKFGRGGRKSMRLPKVLSWEQQDGLIQACGNNRQRNTGIRDTALVALLLATGLRREEAAGLQIADCDISHGMLRVIGKGNKERVIRFDPQDCGVAAALEQYIQSRPTGKRNLFLARNGRPMTAGMIYQQVTRYLGDMQKAGSVDLQAIGAKGPHLLRHTAASRMLANGVPILQVQQNMGHASLMTLQIYAHLLPERSS